MYNTYEYLYFRHLYFLPEARGISVPDQRIEVLMSHLDESSMALFKRTFSVDPDVVANVHGTSDLSNSHSALHTPTHTVFLRYDGFFDNVGERDRPHIPRRPTRPRGLRSVRLLRERPHLPSYYLFYALSFRFLIFNTYTCMSALL